MLGLGNDRYEAEASTFLFMSCFIIATSHEFSRHADFQVDGYHGCWFLLIKKKKKEEEEEGGEEEEEERKKTKRNKWTDIFRYYVHFASQHNQFL